MILALLLFHFGSVAAAAQGLDMTEDGLRDVLKGPKPITSFFAQRVISALGGRSAEFDDFLANAMSVKRWEAPVLACPLFARLIQCAMDDGMILNGDREGFNWTTKGNIGFRVRHLPGKICLYPGKTMRYFKKKEPETTSAWSASGLAWGLAKVGLLQKGKQKLYMKSVRTTTHTAHVWILDEREVFQMNTNDAVAVRFAAGGRSPDVK